MSQPKAPAPSPTPMAAWRWRRWARALGEEPPERWAYDPRLRDETVVAPWPAQAAPAWLIAGFSPESPDAALTALGDAGIAVDRAAFVRAAALVGGPRDIALQWSATVQGPPWLRRWLPELSALALWRAWCPGETAPEVEAAKLDDALLDAWITGEGPTGALLDTWSELAGALRDAPQATPFVEREFGPDPTRVLLDMFERTGRAADKPERWLHALLPHVTTPRPVLDVPRLEFGKLLLDAGHENLALDWFAEAFRARGEGQPLVDLRAVRDLASLLGLSQVGDLVQRWRPDTDVEALVRALAPLAELGWSGAQVAQLAASVRAARQAAVRQRRKKARRRRKRARR